MEDKIANKVMFYVQEDSRSKLEALAWETRKSRSELVRLGIQKLYEEMMSEKQEEIAA